MTTYDRFVAAARMAAANPADPEHAGAKQLLARLEQRAAMRVRMGLAACAPKFSKVGDTLVLDMLDTSPGALRRLS
jgi:hypothetical protein